MYIRHRNFGGIPAKVVEYEELALLVTIQYKFNSNLIWKLALSGRVRLQYNICLFQVMCVLHRRSHKTIFLQPQKKQHGIHLGIICLQYSISIFDKCIVESVKKMHFFYGIYDYIEILKQYFLELN